MESDIDSDMWGESLMVQNNYSYNSANGPARCTDKD